MRAVPGSSFKRLIWLLGSLVVAVASVSTLASAKEEKDRPVLQP